MQMEKDFYQAAKCPVCGKFLDKVEALVMENVSGGTVPLSRDQNDTMIAWVCTSEKCRQPKK